MNKISEMEKLKAKIRDLVLETNKQHSLLTIIALSVESGYAEDDDLKKALHIAAEINFGIERKLEEYGEVIKLTKIIGDDHD